MFLIFMFRSVNHLKLFFTWCELGFEVPFSFNIRLFSALFAENTLYFHHWITLTALSELKWPYMSGPVYILSIMFYWPICLFLCWYHTVLITEALRKVFKLGNVSSIFVLLPDCFGQAYFFAFCIHFRISLSVSFY